MLVGNTTIDNPLNGILPNFSVFGVQFTELWQKLVGGLWAASAKFKDLVGTAAQNPNTSGGAVPDGTPFYLTTANGVWHVESSSTDSISVSVGAVYVVNGAVSPQLRSSTTFSLVWERGAWRIKSGSIDRTTEDLFRIGEAFTGGC